MIQNLQPAMEADQDLHIAKHVEPENLPAMIQPIMSLAQSDAERDMLLLSLIITTAIRAKLSQVLEGYVK